MATQLFTTPGIVYLKDGKLIFRDVDDTNQLEVRTDGIFLNGQDSVLFVDADNGDNANSGDSQATAKATIAAAITAATAGDTIYVLPGTYAENVDISKDYISLIGLREGGYARPDIAPAAGVGVTVSGQGCVVKRIRAVSADDDACLVEGNGFKIIDCVLDGDGNGATDAGLRLKGNADDDGYTASEGLVKDTLIRGSGGYGVALDTGDAPGNGVGGTHNVFENVRLLGNTGVDVVALDTGSGTVYSVQDSQFRGCSFMSRNKATHIDLDTTNGAGNTGNVFEGCFFFDDTIDTTAIKVATANAGVIGCFSLDGVIDGDLLD